MVCVYCNTSVVFARGGANKLAGTWFLRLVKKERNDLAAKNQQPN